MKSLLGQLRDGDKKLITKNHTDYHSLKIEPSKGYVFAHIFYKDMKNCHLDQKDEKMEHPKQIERILGIL